MIIRKHTPQELAKINRLSAGVANSYTRFTITGKTKQDRKIDRQMKAIFNSLNNRGYND